MPADLVLIAVGFTGPERPLLDALRLDLDDRGNVAAPLFAASQPGDSLRRRAGRPVADRDRDRRGPALRADRRPLAVRPGVRVARPRDGP